MTREGPALAALTRRLSECPPDFLLEPLVGGRGEVDAGAVVSDLSRALGGTLLNPQQLALFRPARPETRARIRTALIASWVLYDAWFRQQGLFGQAAVALLAGGLAEVADVVDAPQFVSDPDRREELVRLILRALELRPAGESEAQATDRLTTLSSVERNRILRETRAAQERVREIREAMKRKAAEEAAAAYGRE